MSEFDINKIKRDNLNRLLKERGIKAVELAKLMGVSTSHVSRLRSGGAKIGDKSLAKLCKALNVDIREFFEQNNIIASSALTDQSARHEAEHHRLILRFIDKKWGLDTNQILLRIERLAPPQRITVKNLLEAFANALEKGEKNE